jgi:hypothetical protein
MTRNARFLPIFLFSTAAAVYAQTPPASGNGTLAVRGCVATAPRDGSLAPKAGTYATPTTAPMEANNPDVTVVYILSDAQPVAAAAPTGGTSAAPATLSYALTGHEAELVKLHGQRVEITGTRMPKQGGGTAAKGPSVPDSIERIRVSTIKAIPGSCSATKK